MARKPATVDDVREAVTVTEPPEIATLVESGILTYADGLITWRDGHLTHLAHEYKSDPAKCERDYSDDLAIARQYSADEWSTLLEA